MFVFLIYKNISFSISDLTIVSSSWVIRYWSFLKKTINFEIYAICAFFIISVCWFLTVCALSFLFLAFVFFSLARSLCLLSFFSAFYYFLCNCLFVDCVCLFSICARVCVCGFCMFIPYYRSQQNWLQNLMVKTADGNNRVNDVSPSVGKLK